MLYCLAGRPTVPKSSSGTSPRASLTPTLSLPGAGARKSFFRISRSSRRSELVGRRKESCFFDSGPLQSKRQRTHSGPCHSPGRNRGRIGWHLLAALVTRRPVHRGDASRRHGPEDLRPRVTAVVGAGSEGYAGEAGVSILVQWMANPFTSFASPQTATRAFFASALAVW